jgi:putative hemolysin
MSESMWLVLAMLALGAGTVCSALFQSLRELSRTTLEEIAEIRARAGGRERVRHILRDVEGHAAAVGLPRVVCNLVFVVAIIGWLTQVRGLAAPGLIEISLGIAFSTLAVWLFGLVLPASIARHAGEVTVYSWTPLLRVAYVLTAPVRSVLGFVDEVVRRLSGKGEFDGANAMEEELLSVVEEAQQEGHVDQSEKEMIEAVVEFRNLTVSQVMTPRTEIEAMELSNDLGAVTAMMRRSSHSRIPVYEGNLDSIAGVFYVKDLIRWLAGEGSRGGRTFDLRSLLRPALFVPETKTVRELLRELLAKRVHIAIVADEFGGTAGLVTFEDIVEELVGDIQDEYEHAPEVTTGVVVDRTGRTATIDARTYIDDANDELGVLGIELPESEDYDTVGGYVTVTLGRIPPAGEVIEREGVRLTVLEAEPTRVVRVRLDVLGETLAPRSKAEDVATEDEAKREDDAEPPELRTTGAGESVGKA